jgi:hypothetical protein
VSHSRPNIGHYARDGMAQASSFESSLCHRVSDAINDNDISRRSSSKLLHHESPIVNDDDLNEITISSIQNQSNSSSNHHGLSLIDSSSYHTHPVQNSSLTTSSSIKIAVQKSSSTSAKHPLVVSSLSNHSLCKRTNTPIYSQEQSQQLSIASSKRENLLSSAIISRSTSKQSIVDTLARKSSTAPVALAQQCSSAEHDNVHATHRGDD